MPCKEVVPTPMTARVEIGLLEQEVEATIGWTATERSEGHELDLTMTLDRGAAQSIR